MKYRATFLILLSLFLAWQSCDKIEAPYVRTSPNGNIIDTLVEEVKKTVLIEEFTGHHCPNCPGGALAVENIANEYGSQIVVISVHTNYFGRPTLSFPADYRTPVGNEIDNFFGMEAGLPSGMVSRSGYPTETHALGPDELHGRVIEILEKDAVMDVRMELNYNAVSRNAELVVTVSLLEEMQRKMYLSVYVTEDSIVSPQKNSNPAIGPTPEILDYVHRHVLRGAVTDAWGDILCDGGLLLPAGTGYIKTYNYSLPANWVDDQCAFVAFVYDGDSYEVLQAAEVKAKK